MGTKNRPGKFDCYNNANPDEPMFILLGRDPMAGALVREWAEWRKQMGEPVEKIAEALACADAMDAWASSLGKEPLAITPMQKCGNGATNTYVMSKTETSGWRDEQRLATARDESDDPVTCHPGECGVGCTCQCSECK
jgi:hypothetical protein